MVGRGVVGEDAHGLYEVGDEVVVGRVLGLQGAFGNQWEEGQEGT